MRIFYCDECGVQVRDDDDDGAGRLNHAAREHGGNALFSEPLRDGRTLHWRVIQCNVWQEAPGGGEESQ